MFKSYTSNTKYYICINCLDQPYINIKTISIIKYCFKIMEVISLQIFNQINKHIYEKVK